MTNASPPVSTLPELVRARAGAEPGTVALVLDGERELVLGDWVRRATALAGHLRDRGVEPGVPVGLWFGDAGWLDYAVADLGVHLAGGVVVGLPADLAPDDVVDRLAHCGAAGLIHAPGRRAPGFCGWCATPAELSGPHDAVPDRLSAEDVAEIVYTSGTTGRPKPVAISHANLTYGRTARGNMVGGSDRILCAVPVGTNAGHSAIMLAMLGTGTVQVLSRTDPATIAGMVARLRPELAIIAPSTLLQWLADGTFDRTDLSSLTTLMLGSAPLHPAVLARLTRRLPGVRMLVGYGSTESAPAFVHQVWQEPEPGAEPAGILIGAARGGTEVRVVDRAGTALPPGTVGEICLRSPAPQRWYHGTPDTGTNINGTVFSGGWTRMGDLGMLDGAGRLSFFDRAADAIHSGQGLVSSLRVEDVLYRHPAVAEVAAIGVPDGDGGQSVAAVVVTGAATVPAEELRAFAAERLAPHEVPAKVFVVDRLPHGAIGKPLKRRLREQFA